MTSKTQTSQEESTMEEILSSIRQIISGDKKTDTSEAEPSIEVERADSNDEEILDLINMLKKEEDNDSSEQEKDISMGGIMTEGEDVELEKGNVIDPDSLPEEAVAEEAGDQEEIEEELLTISEDEIAGEVSMEESDEVLEREDHSTVDEEPAPAPRQPGEPYLSEISITQAAEALDTLSKLTKKTQQDFPATQTVGNLTVDNLMREVLRPLLREWLEANLPSIVRAIVTEEVQRIVRQQRGGSTDGGADVKAKGREQDAA